MDRRDWPTSRYELGEEPGEDLRQATTAVQRLEMMWPLVKEAWLLAGRPISDYRRADAPGRVIRPPQRE